MSGYRRLQAQKGRKCYAAGGGVGSGSPLSDAGRSSGAGDGMALDDGAPAPKRGDRKGKSAKGTNINIIIPQAPPAPIGAPPVPPPGPPVVPPPPMPMVPPAGAPPPVDPAAMAGAPPAMKRGGRVRKC